MMRRTPLIVVVVACSVAVLLPPASAATVSFPYGVGAADVRHDRAILWTATSGASSLRLEVSTSPDFHKRTRVRGVEATAATGFTVAVPVALASPGTRYYYRFVTHKGKPVRSPTGTFVSAPSPDAAAALKLVYAGDWDATGDPAAPGIPSQQCPPANVGCIGRFEAFDRVVEENPDVFAAIGDTIYSDSGWNDVFGIPDASTVDQYRAKYRESLAVIAEDSSHFPLQDLRAAMSFLSIWDDHEVHNDYDGQTVDPEQYANGTQVFKEYWPLAEGPGGVAYRSFRWGSDVEIFVLDERSYRSADVAAVCQDDPAPTLPSAIREFGGLPPAPPAGCLDAINDPSRTFLGAEQLAWFKQGLEGSTATWKLVINELAIGQLWGVPYDRWEGYAAERADLINFISSNDIRNVVWLTTDLHTNLAQPVFLDNIDARDVSAGREFINGPIQTNTLLAELIDLFGEDGAGGFVQLLTLLVSPSCAHLDIHSYGLVEYDPGTQNLSVSWKSTVPAAGGGGTVVPNAFPDVGTVDPCAFTLTPE